jgi:AraC-like DNA-binding protein
MDYLNFQTLLPTRILRPYVQSYWYMKSTLPAYHEEFMHPEGGYGIVFNLGNDVYLDSQHLSERVMLDGTNTVSRKMGFIGNIEMIGIRFYPGGAYPFFGIPLSELKNSIGLLDVLDRPALMLLHEQLCETQTLTQKVAHLENWLLRHLQREQSPLIAASLAMIRSNQPHELYISQRQLERLYKTQVGITPIQYARLLRVNYARQALKDTHFQSTVNIGMELGFYDQSHFIRDFKSIVGMTPLRYMQRSLERR